MAHQDFTNTQLIAINKAVSSSFIKSIRDGLSPGTQDCDFRVRVVGSVRVGEDFTKRVTRKLDWERLALAFANRLSEKALDSAVREFASNEEQEYARERVRSLFETIEESEETVCKGLVTGKISLEYV